MTLETITAALKQKLQYAPPMNAKVTFDFGDDGALTVDTNETPASFTREKSEDSDLTLGVSLETFNGILNGTQDPNIAFMMGKLKVKGNMGLAMKLNSILED